METCFYFAENYDNFGQFLSILKDEEDTDFISSLIDNSNDPVLIQNFIFISSNFRPLAEAVTKLQSRQSLVESLTIVQKLRSDLTLEPYKSKLEAILKKNPDLQKFIEFSNVLSGKTVTEWQNYMKDAEKFKNAQIVSVEIERVFSAMGDFQAAKRQFLSVSNLRQYSVIYWYLNVVNSSDLIQFQLNFKRNFS